MAAYNAGAARLKEVIDNQNTRDFFDMYLPEETERYVFRIVALKEIILNKERYGIDISEQELYKPLHAHGGHSGDREGNTQQYSGTGHGGLIQNFQNKQPPYQKIQDTKGLIPDKCTY